MARHVIPRKLRGQFGAVLLETRIQDLADIVLSGIDAGQYLEPMKTTVSSRGRIVLPAELRQQDAIEAGQEFKLVRLNRGEYRLVRVEQVDIVGEKLSFVSDQIQDGERPLGSLFGSMKGTTVVAPGVDLTEPTAPEWGKLDGE